MGRGKPKVAPKAGLPPAKAMPLVVDTNVFVNISEGNTHAAEALSRQAKLGQRIYIARASYQEFVIGAPSAFHRTHAKRMLRDLGITLAPPTDRAARVAAYAQNIGHAPLDLGDFKHPMTIADHRTLQRDNRAKANKPGPMTQYNRVGRPGDMFVAAETKALNGRLWTLDRQLRNQALNQGVAIADESFKIGPVAGGKGVADPVRGRQLLGLKPIDVTPAGKIKFDFRLKAIRFLGAARVAAGSAVLFGVGIAVSLLLGWLASSMAKDRMERDRKKEMEEAGAEIDKRVKALAHEIAWKQIVWSLGGKVAKIYATVVLHVLQIPHGNTESEKSLATEIDVVVKDVYVWDANREEKKPFEYFIPDPVRGRYGYGKTVKGEELIRSFEVAIFTPDEIEIFAGLSHDYIDLKRRADHGSRDPLVAEEMEIVREDILALFGEDFGAFDNLPSLGPAASS